MIFRMKQTIITIVLIVFISTVVNGQNAMKLDEYIISSTQLDSIINMVLNDVENEDYVVVSASNNNDTIYVSAISSNKLRYNTNIIGYTPKGNITILFRSSSKDLVTKKADSNKKNVSCIPPPKKSDIFPVLGKDGLKEWYYIINNGEIILFRKFLKW